MVALLLAIIAFSAPLLHLPFDPLIEVGLPMGGAWMLFFCFAAYKLGKRVIWITPIAPLALFWSAFAILCMRHGDCV
jgi:hypothetical protein